MNALRADAPQASKPSIRAATIDDLDALLQLETASFDADGLSRRSYRKFLHRSTATILVAERRGILVGALVLLFRRSSAIARLYSLAVAQESRGHGVGRALLGAAEQAALERDCAVLRLEVRVDNDAARSLYESEGFTAVDRIGAYYADDADAIRFERPLWDEARPVATVSRWA